MFYPGDASPKVKIISLDARHLPNINGMLNPAKSYSRRPSLRAYEVLEENPYDVLELYDMLTVS